MTPEERLLFREFLKSIQGIPPLMYFINFFSDTDEANSWKLARIIDADYYLESFEKKGIENFKENVSAEVPLKSSGKSVDDLFNYLDNTLVVQLNSDVREYIKNNYEKITPELIFQEEKALQNEYIEELHLKSGLSKKQALRLTKFDTQGNNREMYKEEIRNEIASALLKHPEIKKLGLENAGELDEHAAQVVKKVMDDIRNGKDTSGVFVPYSEKINDLEDMFEVGTVSGAIDAWVAGRYQPIEVKKITHDDINKELLEGINIKHSDLNEDVIVTKSEKYLKEEDRKKEELEKEEPKLAEKRAKDLALNHKILPDEVVFSDDEEDMAFYKECFDPEIVPGLKKKLFEKEISRLNISQYAQFEQEVFDMIDSSASGDNMAYGGYSLTMVRHLIRYVSAKQDGLFKKGSEDTIDHEKIDQSKTENKKYLDELDKIVKQSELFKSHLTDPVPTYEPTDGSYLNTYKKNREQYINKLNNSFDYLSNDKKNELLKEAQKLSKDHPYITDTDIMKYYIRQESEILGLYHECVDPDDVDKSLPERHSAPFTFESIGRRIGPRGRTYEKEQEKLKKQKDSQVVKDEPKQEIKEEVKLEEPKKEEPKPVEEVKIEVQPEIKEEVQEILQPEIKEEVKLEEPKKEEPQLEIKEEPQFTEDIEFEEPQIIEERPVRKNKEWLPDEQTLGIAYREMTRHIDVLSDALGCRPEGYTMPEGLSKNGKTAELLNLLQNDSMRLSKLKGEGRDVMMATIDSVLDSWKKGELDKKVAVPTPVDRHRDYVTAEALYNHIAKQQDLNEKHYMENLAGVNEIREASMEYMIFRKLQTEEVIDNILGYGIRDDLKSYKYLADPQNNYLTSKEKQNNLKNKISQINDAFMEELFKKRSISKEELDYYKAHHESFTPEAADMFFTQEYDQLLTSYAVQFHGSKEIESDPNLLSIDSALAYNLIQKAKKLPEKENVIKAEIKEKIEIKKEEPQAAEEVKQNAEPVKEISNNKRAKKLKFTNQFIAKKVEKTTVKDNQRIKSEGVDYGGVPIEIHMTNEIKYMINWYAKNKANLSPEADAYFNAQYESARYFEKLSMTRESNKKTPTDMNVGFYYPSLKDQNEFEKGEYSITNLGKQKNQTSESGCWSCAFENLLRSRGVEIPQEMIRFFRSNSNIGIMNIEGYKTDSLEKDSKGIAGKRNVALQYITDTPVDIISRADLMLKVLPNTAMRTKSFSFPTEEMLKSSGVNEDTIDEKLLGNKMLETVRDAIGLSRSPVAVYFGGHYRTISSVNIEKRTIKWVDSMDQDPNAEREIKIDDLIAHCRTARPDASIEFTWMEDLVPDEKGNCGVSGFEDYQYTDNILSHNGNGSLTSSDDYVQNGILATKSVDDNNFMILETVCLPKGLITLSAYKHQTPPEIETSGKPYVYAEDPYPLPTNEHILNRKPSAAPDKIDDLAIEDLERDFKAHRSPENAVLENINLVIDNWDLREKYFPDEATKEEYARLARVDANKVEIAKSIKETINRMNKAAAAKGEKALSFPGWNMNRLVEYLSSQQAAHKRRLYDFIFKENISDKFEPTRRSKLPDKDHILSVEPLEVQQPEADDDFHLLHDDVPVKQPQIKTNPEADDDFHLLHDDEPVKQTQIKTGPEADDDFRLLHDDVPVNNVQNGPVIQEADPVTELNRHLEGLLYEKIIRSNPDMYLIAFGLQYDPENANEFREAAKNIDKDLLVEDGTRRNALRKHYKDWFRQAENLEEIQKLCTDDELNVLPYLDVERFLDKMSEMQLENLTRYNAALAKKVQQNVSLNEEKLEVADNVKEEVKEEIKKEEPQIAPVKEEIKEEEIKKEEPVKEEIKKEEPQIDPEMQEQIKQQVNVIANSQGLVEDMLKQQLGDAYNPEEMKAVHNKMEAKFMKDDIYETLANEGIIKNVLGYGLGTRGETLNHLVNLGKDQNVLNSQLVEIGLAMEALKPETMQRLFEQGKIKKSQLDYYNNNPQEFTGDAAVEYVQGEFYKKANSLADQLGENIPYPDKLEKKAPAQKEVPQQVISSQAVVYYDVKYGKVLNKLAKDLESTKGFFTRDSDEFKKLNAYLNSVDDFSSLDKDEMDEVIGNIRGLVNNYNNHMKNKPIDNDRRRNREGIADMLSALCDDYASGNEKQYVDSILERDKCYEVIKTETTKKTGHDIPALKDAFGRLMIMNIMDAKAHGRHQLGSFDEDVVSEYAEKFADTDTVMRMIKDVDSLKALVADHEANPGLLNTKTEAKLAADMLKAMAGEKNIDKKLANERTVQKNDNAIKLQ